MYKKYGKRFLDILLSGIGIIVLSPLLMIVAILVRVKLGTPVIFIQERPGKDEKIFKLYKFRSMTDKRDNKGDLLPDEERLTAFGKKLRRTSLDELPELFNVLIGDMSLIGPRPLLVKYLPLYNKQQNRRHEVRPGFSGYAQVNGRNNMSWQDKFEKDVWYVDNISFAQDMRILLKTVQVVLKHDGITSDTSATMEEFKGNEENLF